MLVRDNPDRQRYELIDPEGDAPDGGPSGETVAGFIQYRIRDGRWWLIHTEMGDRHKGTGVASFLVRRTLDDLRERGAIVVPTCPFVGGWIRRHPDYQDLVDQEKLHQYKRSRGAGRRRTVDALPPAPCRHLPTDLGALPQPWPADGCAECLAAGHRNWVHLRACQTCGHVGCCDSSPGRHATAHAGSSDHPLVRSYEPGETWWFCYVDTVTFEVAHAPPAPSHP